MGKPKKTKSKEELLAKKRDNERKRYAKIRKDPELYAEYKRKNKEKYERRKREGKVVKIHDMPPRAQRALRKKWKDESKKAYQKRKEKKMNIQRYIDGNSPPESDTEDINFQNNQNVEEPENIPGCSNSRPVIVLPSTSSPISSPGSSPRSSACVSPRAKQVIRKLRYKKDKEIESLRHQLQSVKKLNDLYRKQLSRRQDIGIKALPVQQLAHSTENKDESCLPLLIQSQDDFAEQNNQTESQASLLRKGILDSYSNISSYKTKKIVADTLQPHLQNPANDSTSRKLLKKLFRRRHKAIKNVAASKKKKDVQDFLSEDQNSSCAAGKKEFVKKQGVKVQIRYLTDSLKNLHSKFIAAYKYRLSYAVFCNLKPFWILPASRRPRNSCLCVIHENFRLLVSAFSKFNIINYDHPTKLLKTICCDVNNPQCLLRNCMICKKKKVVYLDFDNSKEIRYFSWNNKKENIVTNRSNKTIRIVKKEQIITQAMDAVKTFENMIDIFLKHTGRIVTQQKAIKKIKNSLQAHEALIHIDFSENYKCAYGNEIQAAHFGGSKPQISIHTSVLYFFDDHGQNHTQSFSTISPNLRHDAAAVWAHLEPILQYLKTVAPQITQIHMLSDSATSQYRNYKFFFVMSGLKWTSPRLSSITWNFSESGHGKGAPDGVGAVLKRTADAFVNQGIDVPDFETFSRLLSNKLNNVIIKIVTDEDILKKDQLFPNNLQSFRGTQKVHQIVWNSSKSSVALRILSCTEESCLTKASFCQHGNHLGFHFVRDQDIEPRQSMLMPGSDSDNDYVQDQQLPVANLERGSIFSALSELELPSELRRTVLDTILTEDHENKTESPLSVRTRNLFDSDSDDSDYNIF